MSEAVGCVTKVQTEILRRLIWVFTVCSDLSVRMLRTNMVSVDKETCVPVELYPVKRLVTLLQQHVFHPTYILPFSTLLYNSTRGGSRHLV